MRSTPIPEQALSDGPQHWCRLHRLEALRRQLLGDPGRRSARGRWRPHALKHPAGFPLQHPLRFCAVFRFQLGPAPLLPPALKGAALAGDSMSMVCSPTVACITDRKASHYKRFVCAMAWGSADHRYGHRGGLSSVAAGAEPPSHAGGPSRHSPRAWLGIKDKGPPPSSNWLFGWCGGGATAYVATTQ